jgi:HEAT repeat protein
MTTNHEPPEVEALIKELANVDHFIRADAARRLVNMKEDASRAWPFLLALQADPWYQVRIQLPRAAVHLKAPHEQAIPALLALLEDPDESIRFYARWALEELGQGPYYSSLPRQAPNGKANDALDRGGVQ